MIKSNIVLIGMPGAGKSTVGVLLAKETAKDFVDTDVLIQVNRGKTLQDILEASGYMVLRQIEEEILLGNDFQHHVIATGGSAVYSEKGMHHLKRDAVAVFLDVDLAVLKNRIHNYETRGIAKRPDQSFASLFEERCKLYNKYADVIVRCGTEKPDVVVAEIIKLCKSLQ